MARKPVIGIDLGTSHSAAAVYQNGKAEIIPIKGGGSLVPSYIYYMPNSTDVLVGTAANDFGGKCMNNFIFDAKRIIGRTFDDAYVQKLKNRREYDFKIVRGEDDKAQYEIKLGDLMVCRSPEQVSSEILKELRVSANEKLGAEVTEAVISVPAYFSNAQRAATKEAAKLAGLEVLKLISEPVAGAIYYTKEKRIKKGTFLVFDMGGGTLDVSIIKLSKKIFGKEIFEVLSVEGDTFLGGRDYDNVLVDHFIPEIIEKFCSDYIPSKLIMKLKEKCIVLKKELSTKTVYNVSLDIFNNEDDDFSISLTQDDFKRLTNELTKRAISLVQKCLTGVGLSKSDIDEVILVGGMTRSQAIRDELRTFFGNKELKTDLNPDEAVALGAAIQASALKYKSKELEKYNVAEVTPLSLGIAVGRGLMNVAIKKNSPLPAKGHLPLATAQNNQKNSKFKIFEGERKECALNNLLGELTINNLPEAKAGDVHFEVNFLLNDDGILEVEAHETSTKQRNKLIVTMENYSLCQKKISAMIEDAEKNRKEDDLFEKYNNTHEEISKVYNAVLYVIQKISPETDRSFVKNKCEELKTSLDQSDRKETIDKLVHVYARFRLTTQGIIGQVIDIKWPEFS